MLQFTFYCLVIPTFRFFPRAPLGRGEYGNLRRHEYISLPTGSPRRRGEKPKNHINKFERSFFLGNVKKFDRASEAPIPRVYIMHESATPQNSPEKPNWIQITHKALSIFLLHVRHDKASLSKQNDHLSLLLKLLSIGKCRDWWKKIAHFQGEWTLPGLSLFANPISRSPSNMSQHCPQTIPDSNSESFRPRKSSMSWPLAVNCQKNISHGQVNKTRFTVSASEIVYVRLCKRSANFTWELKFCR